MSGPTKSQGDPRVLFAMNLVLSSIFAWVVVTGLAFGDIVTFDWAMVAGMALVLVVVTHFVTR